MLSKDGEATVHEAKSSLFSVPSTPKPSHREGSTQIALKLSLVLFPLEQRDLNMQHDQRGESKEARRGALGLHMLCEREHVVTVSPRCQGQR